MAWGMGHGAWGMGHGAWGMGHGHVKAGFDGQRKSTYGFKAHINVDEDGLIKPTDYKPLTPQGKPFNWLHYDMAKARYMGLSRNRTRFQLMCVALDWKHLNS